MLESHGASHRRAPDLHCVGKARLAFGRRLQGIAGVIVEAGLVRLHEDRDRPAGRRQPAFAISALTVSSEARIERISRRDRPCLRHRRTDGVGDRRSARSNRPAPARMGRLRRGPRGATVGRRGAAAAGGAAGARRGGGNRPAAARRSGGAGAEGEAGEARATRRRVVGQRYGQRRPRRLAARMKAVADIGSDLMASRPAPLDSSAR